jgi:very-short-patch-repair endonuclease
MQKERARQLRTESTPAEALLWRLLRNRQLLSHKFRRQQPLGPFIVDFCCLSARLIIELDGGQHAKRSLEDLRRTKWLQDQGFRVIRFWNHEVMRNPEAVWQQICRSLEAVLRGGAAPPHPASPATGEENAKQPLTKISSPE